MGLFSSSQTTKSTGSFDTKRRPVNPTWVDELGGGLGGEISDLSKIDPNSLVPGADPLQTKGADKLGDLTGTPWNFDGALDLTRGVTQSNAPRTEFVKSSAFMKDFLDPYLQDVVDASLADFDFGAGRTKAQLDLELAGSGAFGGSGSALTKSETLAGLDRGRGSLSAGLRSAGFSQALQAAQNEAARKQAANDTNAALYAGQMDRTLGGAQQIANIASQFGGEQRATAGSQLAGGDVMREIAREEANAVPDFLARRIGMFSGLPLDIWSGEDISGTETSKSKTKSSGSLLDKAGRIAQIAAMFAGSDRNIKRDIRKLATRPDGLGIYLFRYADDLAKRLWGSGWKVGVMAQEVLKVKPEAVARHPAGFLMVDYAQL